MKKRTTPILVPALMLSLVLMGCNMPLTKIKATLPPKVVQVQPTISPEPTSTKTATDTAMETATETPAKPAITSVPEIVHKDLPGAPVGKQLQTVWDQVDENTAAQKQAFGGDDYRNGKYERPFDQQMNYLPLADLVSVQLSREDPLWVYVLFKVDKPFSIDPAANTHFAIELDTDLDNRGNLIIITGMPKSTEWSTDSVLVLTDPDLNVGGVTPVRTDGSLTEGRGYYSEIFNNGKGDDADLAWSRLSKIDASVAQIAFKNTLVDGVKGRFIWLPWADAGMQNWSLFEFNDHISFTQAGYPLKEDAQNYPLKALWGVDNTCRVPSGFTPNGTMPGLCPNSAPAVESGSESSGHTCPPCTHHLLVCPPCVP